MQKFITKSEKHPSLGSLNDKINACAYTSVYEMESDVRGIWDHYFRCYCSHPDAFKEVYCLSEFCEEVFREEDGAMGVKEKEKLVEDIMKLDAKYLKGIVGMLNEGGDDKEEDEERVYEFDVEKLSGEMLRKLRRFVEEKMIAQEREQVILRQRRKREEDLERKRIVQLKKDLGFA